MRIRCHTHADQGQVLNPKECQYGRRCLGTSVDSHHDHRHPNHQLTAEHHRQVTHLVLAPPDQIELPVLAYHKSSNHPIHQHHHHLLRQFLAHQLSQSARIRPGGSGQQSLPHLGRHPNRTKPRQPLGHHRHCLQLHQVPQQD